MHDDHRSKAQLLEELNGLRGRLAELEGPAAPTDATPVEILSLRKTSDGNPPLLGPIADSIPAGIAVLDSQFVLLECNRAYAGFLSKYSSCPAEQALGMRYFDFAPAAQAPIEEAFRAAMEDCHTTALMGVEVSSARPGRHETTYWDFRIVPAIDASGHVQGILVFIQDATTRTVVEDKLQESQERYEAVFESISEGFVVCEVIFDESRTPVDLRVLAANPALKRITGLDHSEAADSIVNRLIHGGEQFWIETFARVASTGEPARADSYSPESGRFFEASAFRLAEDRVACVFTDITERKQMEIDLRNAKDYAENLIQTANVIVLGLDLDANIQVFNQAAEEITGYTLSEVKGRNYADVVLPRDRYPEVWAKFEKLSSTSLVRNYENPILTKHGEERYIAWQNNTLSDHGQATGIISFGIDITERKKAEDALRESEERYRALFESINEGFALHEIICDEAGNPRDYRFLEVNPSFTALTGLKRENVVGRTVTEVIPDIEPAWIERYGRVALTGEPAHFQSYSAAFGKHFEVFAFRPVEGQFGCVFADVTERRRAEIERDATIEFRRIVSETAGVRDLIESAVTFFQERSGCDAVGVRLKEGDDYPYFEARGFPKEFLLLENSLCSRHEEGEVVRDEVGNSVIDCMCGNVICGRFDPSKPFFTSHGSFWTNCTTELLASTTEADRQSRTRNRCNGEGYESVALIRLHVGSSNWGSSS